MKMVIQLKQDGSIQVTYLNPDKNKFPAGIVASDNPLKDNRKRLLASDFKSYSVMEIDEDGLELNVIGGQYDNPGVDDGPPQSGVLHSPVGIACRVSSFISPSTPLIVKDPYDCFNI